MLIWTVAHLSYRHGTSASTPDPASLVWPSHRRWYMLAAEAGHTKAQVFVGDIYDANDGQGMAVHNPDLAVVWYTRAAKGEPCGESCAQV